jgi:hypothetical protein
MAKLLSTTHREEREVAIIAVLADEGLGGKETLPTTTKKYCTVFNPLKIYI